MERIFHTPEGVRDIYNGECSQKRKRTGEDSTVCSIRYGYEDIETPTFEYFEVFSREVGTIPSRELYKFFDREGNTLVLRPDFTPSVSRACATYFSPDQEADKLCAIQAIPLLIIPAIRGRLKETTQMGVERIGDESADADAELLAMTVECMLAAGLTEFQISVGQVDYFKSLLEGGQSLMQRLRNSLRIPDLPEKCLWCGGVCRRTEIKGRHSKSFCGQSHRCLVPQRFWKKPESPDQQCKGSGGSSQTPTRFMKS